MREKLKKSGNGNGKDRKRGEYFTYQKYFTGGN